MEVNTKLVLRYIVYEFVQSIRLAGMEWYA
jgi:hypothetical protein